MPKHRARAPGQRQLRVGELIRHALVELLGRGSLRDPDLQGVSITVTAVDMSPDLKNALAFVMPLGGENAATAVAALNRAAPALRAQVADMIDLRWVPRLAFALDTSFENARRVEEVLRRPEVARDLGDESGDAEDRDRGDGS